MSWVLELHLEKCGNGCRNDGKSGDRERRGNGENVMFMHNERRTKIILKW
jgi:hypothetical protein